MTDTTPKAGTPSFNARVAGTLEFFVKVVAIGVPVFYALGRLYLDSYWETLRLPSSLMGYAAEDYLYFGFMSLAVGVARWVGVELYSSIAYAAVFAAFTAAVAMLMYAMDRYLSTKIRARIAASERRKVEAKTSKQGAAIHYAQIGAAVWSVTTTIFLVLMAAALLLLVPIVFAVKAGQGQAEAEFARYAQPPTVEAKSRRITAHFQRDGAATTAPLVECSDAWCVIFRDGAFAAIPRSEVQRVDLESLPRIGDD